MCCVILCPGPSVITYAPQPGDLTIGVNRAVLAHRVDWWAATDWTVLKHPEYCPDYKVNLFTNAANLCKVKDMAFVDRVLTKEELFKDFNPVEILPPRNPHKPRQHDDGTPIQWGWTIYTATSAAVLAAHLGAKEIRVHGMDWDGIADWDGHKYELKKGEEAWRTRTVWSPQIAKWEHTVEMLEYRGITITRHIPDLREMTEARERRMAHGIA